MHGRVGSIQRGRGLVTCAVLGEEGLSVGELCRDPKVVLARRHDCLLPVQNGHDLAAGQEEVVAAEIAVAQDVPYRLGPCPLSS